MQTLPDDTIFSAETASSSLEEFNFVIIEGNRKKIENNMFIQKLYWEHRSSISNEIAVNKAEIVNLKYKKTLVENMIDKLPKLGTSSEHYPGELPTLFYILLRNYINSELNLQRSLSKLNIMKVNILFARYKAPDLKHVSLEHDVNIGRIFLNTDIAIRNASFESVTKFLSEYCKDGPEVAFLKENFPVFERIPLIYDFPAVSLYPHKFKSDDVVTKRPRDEITVVPPPAEKRVRRSGGAGEDDLSLEVLTAGDTEKDGA